MVYLAGDRVREIFGIALVDKVEHIFELSELEGSKKGQFLGPYRLEVHVFASDGYYGARQQERLSFDQTGLLDAKVCEKLCILAQVGSRRSGGLNLGRI